MGLTKSLAAAFLLATTFLSTSVSGAPTDISVAKRDSSYWVSSIARNGAPAFGDNGSDYKVFRNVQDFGAKGDGTTDDTAAINKAITDGNRCGLGCSSTTTSPALVYFPPGKYLVSEPIVQYYYTQLVGDAVNPPTLIASSGFKGMAVIDSDPYEDDGSNWWINQNNFFRQVRNFVIDLTQMPVGPGAGIHWQVAQATSLQNIVFNMHKDSSETNKQVGVFMDNGSGGFMADLTFNGGQYGAFLGSQQFTLRNMTFSGCQTAVFMQWNWAFTLQDLNIDSCNVGVDMSVGGTAAQTVGSILLVDSKISNTPIGVLTAYTQSSSVTNGTLILDNVDMSTNVPAAVADATKSTLLAGNAKIDSWAQGNTPAGSGSTDSKAIQGSQTAVQKASSLLGSDGNLVGRTKPQYEDVDVSKFVSVKSAGAKGDGKTDDTAAIQKVLDSATSDQVVYFDHGAYLVTDTIKVPKDVRITGEVWPVILAGGDSSFTDASNTKPVFQVGQPGDSGHVEISDVIFATAGAQPGAVMIEWNLQGTTAGESGLWDAHVRIGGAAGTDLQLTQCAKNPNSTHEANKDCLGSALMFHITKDASNVYVENSWFWTADHDLEPEANNQQVDIYNGRGVLIESQGPVWMIGTASEHSVLYNYQLVNASAVYMGFIQTETPYYQGNPDARTPYASQTSLFDPSFDSCTGETCARAWGLRVVNSKDVYVYGAGLYSFFDNYDQQCVSDNNCQDNVVSLESSSDVYIFGLSTKASVNMVTLDGKSVALDKNNRNNFCATLAVVSTESS